MKSHEREEARRLRREEGLSIIQIARRLGVAKSSVSGWVRDIELTEAQVAKLIENQHLKVNQMRAREVNISKHRELRRQYQEEGRAKARERDPLHIAGCMLYWAEGSKSNTSLSFANSDPDMIKFFLHFLRNSLGIPNHDIKMNIHCYTNNGIPLEEIERYWLEITELPIESLKSSIVNNQPSSSQQKGRKLLYGVAHLRVFRVAYLHHIYGAIQEYIGVDKPEWLG
jgi:transcriptional regulator with XRE-family HTH domain